MGKFRQDKLERERAERMGCAYGFRVLICVDDGGHDLPLNAPIAAAKHVVDAAVDALKQGSYMPKTYGA